MCLGQINPEKTKEYRALGTITMYKALKIVDGKPLSLFYGHVWVPGNVMLSSRDTPTLTDFEEATGQVTHGFHFYLYKSPATPVPSWVRRPWRKGRRSLHALGYFRVEGRHIVAVGKYGRSWSAVATKATLINYTIIL